jgi:anaerobic selenocysteine-containing dehydrogenase
LGGWGRRPAWARFAAGKLGLRMTVTERVTFCRICEPLCGMVATVEDARLAQLRPDQDHPLSRGYACPKGIAMTGVQNDPDRVLHPLKRVGGPGEFERVGWDEALSDISSRLRRSINLHGPDSVAWYMGNPGAFSYSHTLWVKGFLDGLGTPHYYSAGSQDVNNRFAASALLYGSPLVLPIPDLKRTRFLFMVGANPLVSHGSVLSAPRIREQLNEIVDRGGRVVVVDPRRTETARQFEHLPIRPDADAWLLLAMLNVIFAEGLADRRFLSGSTSGAEALARWASEFTPERAEAHTGLSAEQVRETARAFAAAESAVAYGRTGSCLGRFGTLVAYLLDALNAVTGNIDSPGGAVFGRPPLSLDEIGERAGLDTYGKIRSRLGGYPDVIGNLPATLLPKEITTPGKGQIRTFFVSAGNPVLSVPDGDALEEALGELDLMVSLDLYVNETNRHADYVLPSTTYLEREDIPVAFLGLFNTPFIQVTKAVVPPMGEARQEWEVIEDISKRIGIAPYSLGALRVLARLGLRLRPWTLIDLLLRIGPKGDLFGLRRSGLSLKKVERHPHGIVLDEQLATGVLRKKVRHASHRVRLDDPEIGTEIERLASANGGSAEFPLRLIGMRELRSHNSWMHNAPLLMRGGRVHSLRMHPADALAAGLTDGDTARIESESGAVEVPVTVTDEMTPGTVALPHGWGHKGGWQLANDAGGANYNLLAPSDPDGLERLAGMAHLSGIPVRVEAAAGLEATPATDAETLAAPV